MGNLHPGGSRSVGGRVFTASAVKQMIDRHKPDHSAGAETSPAGKPHGDSRQAQRLRRQRERQEAKRNGN